MSRMSSELEAIMRYRLAKSETRKAAQEKAEEESFDEGGSRNDDEKNESESLQIEGSDEFISSRSPEKTSGKSKSETAQDSDNNNDTVTNAPPPPPTPASPKRKIFGNNNKYTSDRIAGGKSPPPMPFFRSNPRKSPPPPTFNNINPSNPSNFRSISISSASTESDRPFDERGSSPMTTTHKVNPTISSPDQQTEPLADSSSVQPSSSLSSLSQPSSMAHNLATKKKIISSTGSNTGSVTSPFIEQRKYMFNKFSSSNGSPLPTDELSGPRGPSPLLLQPNVKVPSISPQKGSEREEEVAVVGEVEDKGLDTRTERSIPNFFDNASDAAASSHADAIDVPAQNTQEIENDNDGDVDGVAGTHDLSKADFRDNDESNIDRNEEEYTTEKESSVGADVGDGRDWGTTPSAAKTPSGITRFSPSNIFSAMSNVVPSPMSARKDESFFGDTAFFSPPPPPPPPPRDHDHNVSLEEEENDDNDPTLQNIEEMNWFGGSISPNIGLNNKMEVEYEEDTSDEEFEIDGTTINANIASSKKLTLQSQCIISSKTMSNNKPTKATENPMTNNMILCRYRNKQWFLDEIDTSNASSNGSPPIAASTAISISEIQTKLKAMNSRNPSTTATTNLTKANDYPIVGIEKIVDIATGVHKQQSRLRVRVAAIVDLKLLDTSVKQIKSSSKTKTTEKTVTTRTLRVVLVWQWGYAVSRPIALQSVVAYPTATPISKTTSQTNKAVYIHPKTLSVADGLIFLGGSYNSQPAVFLCKPHVRDAWSTNLVLAGKKVGVGAVSSLAVMMCAHRQQKYLAIALDDGNVSIWAYDLAVSTNRLTENVATAEKTNTLPNQKVLRPLYQSEASSSLEVLKGLPIYKTENNEEKDDKNEKHNGLVCTHMSWKSFRSSDSTVSLLAVAYTEGVIIYSVISSFTIESADKSNDNLDNTRHLNIIGAIKVDKKLEAGNSMVSWLELGPLSSPCVSILTHDQESLHIYMATLNLTSTNDDELPATATRPLTVLGGASFPVDNIQTDLSVISSLGAIICHWNGGLSSFYPTFNMENTTHSSKGVDSLFLPIAYPVTSTPLGVDSSGHILCGNKKYDDILYVHSHLHCQINSQRKDAKHHQHGCNLTIQYWLCKSTMGDKKDKLEQNEEVDFPTGGATTSAICALSCSDDSTGEPLTPKRIVRDLSGKFCAVIFSSFISEECETVEIDKVPHAYSLIAVDANENVKDLVIREGRDVAFVMTSNNITRVLVLSDDGCSLSEIALPDTESKSAELLLNEAPIFGTTTKYSKYMNILRVLSTPTNRIFFNGAQNISERECILSGGIYNDNLVSTPSALRGKIPKFWFQYGEKFLTLTELAPITCTEKCNIAVATSSRVLIMSGELEILAETKTLLMCDSLVPIGSHCVAFLSYLTKERSSGGGRFTYLSCLKGNQSVGVIATLPSSRFRRSMYSVLAVRPDRFIHLCSQNTSRVCTKGEEMKKAFTSPIPVTRPILLLEPLVANALCSNDKIENKRKLLEIVIERFGPKFHSNPHSDKEGIGTLGAGITNSIYDMLRDHDCLEAISYFSKGLQSSNRVALPTWVPIETKANISSTYKSTLNSLVSGDNYLSSYLQSVEKDNACMLPTPMDPTSNLSKKLATRAVDACRTYEAVKLLDLAGSLNSDSDLIHILLSMQVKSEPKLTELLNGLVSSDSKDQFDGSARSTSALIQALKEKDRKNLKRITSQLAPSFQKGLSTTRRSRKLLAENLDMAVQEESKSFEGTNSWKKSLEESKNIWNIGPFNNKEEILLLDRIEEWTGRSKPAKLGKVGAEIAAQSGERTLQKLLLDAAKEQDAGDDDISCNSFKEGWVDGIGDGRTDEDNLSLYLRFSEGADEDNNWRTEGVKDLSQYQNAVTLVDPEFMDIEATTSYVDEGEVGKVKLLHDLVFNRNTTDGGERNGLMIEVKRGSSLDTGMCHTSAHESRQRSTIEFWYFLPTNSAGKEIILARKSVCFPGETLENLCSVTERDSMLWELVALPSGRLEFRSCGGSVFDSDTTESQEESSHLDTTLDDDEGNVDIGLVSRQTEDGRGGWNHACLTFSCREMESLTKCEVTLSMKGVSISSAIVSIEPPGLDQDDIVDIDNINEALERSALMFGLGGDSGVRLTDIRCWSCERSIDDVKMMMYESLTAAEIKKKFGFKIRNKRIGKTGKGGMLAPPQASSLRNAFVPPPDKQTTREQVDINENDQGVSAKVEQDPQTDLNFASFGEIETVKENVEEKVVQEKELSEEQVPEDFFASPLDVMNSESTKKSTNSLFPQSTLEDPNSEQQQVAGIESMNSFQSDVLVQVGTDDTSFSGLKSLPMQQNCLLSREVRNSAAAALVRGPPATRHFGGNRGGLPSGRHLPLSSRRNIGSIAICGSEKTVIFTHDKSPPGKTYPIGASGAIISDIMDDRGTEYLCCFLAKDKRLVVFDLHSKVVVSQLQMTTKLNFWRFLPPMTHGNTLVFMLITPVGGFHWMPLDESPRPRQIWKRSPELQGKKVVSYEEGGSNGLVGDEYRSTVALLLTSSSSNSTPVEAWCLTTYGGSSIPLRVSSSVLGAALYCTPADAVALPEAFEPILILVSNHPEVMNRVDVEMFMLSTNTMSKTITKGPLYASVSLNDKTSNENIAEPTLAMGTSSDAFCLCCGEYIVVILRKKGLIFSITRVDNQFRCVGKQELNHYVVDAAIRVGDIDDSVEVVCLMCEQDNVKDGRIVTVDITYRKAFL